MELTMQKPLVRGAGVLLPVSALPSPYGIGTFGKTAYHFVDFLRRAGQRYWQILPLCPTGYGDSPYQSVSAFAGNPYFIDLDMIVSQGLLKKEDIEAYTWGNKKTEIDYSRQYNNRYLILRQAFKNSDCAGDKKYIKFIKENKIWLDEYALFMAIKDSQNGAPFSKWPEDLRMRESSALKKARADLSEDINFHLFLQYHFFSQWEKLKAYAGKNGVSIIGDIPIYVAGDSADVWEYHDQFQLDESRMPTRVAGVPPDIFSEDGQLWGNPLYDWDKMKLDDFKWWQRRMEMCARLYDIIRIDHFIGIVNYYSIDAAEETAKNGKWIKGPGADLLKAIVEAVGEKKIIAEDLGSVTQKVRSLMKKFGFPGMKILQYAFDGNPGNDNLPHNYTNNMVVYGGTHDNEPLASFVSGQPRGRRRFAEQYLDVKSCRLLPRAIIRAGYASCADAAVFQMQDYLELHKDSRMNIPSTLGGNWTWRMRYAQMDSSLAQRMRQMAEMYSRIEN